MMDLNNIDVNIKLPAEKAMKLMAILTICQLNFEEERANSSKDAILKEDLEQLNEVIEICKSVMLKIDEMRDIFIKKVFDIFKSDYLLLEKMDADEMESWDANYRKIENIIKKSLVIDGFAKLKGIFNAIALDLSFFKKVDKIYFDKNELADGKRPDMITLDFDIIGMSYSEK